MEQEKGCERSARCVVAYVYIVCSRLIHSHRNRLLAQQQLWLPTSDDNYDAHTPSLVPVFDPAFVETSIATVSPLEHAVLHHTSETPPPAMAPPGIASLSPPHNNNEASFLEDRGTLSLELPEIDEDVDYIDFRDWITWSAPRRIAAVRRWIIHAAHKYGPVECWGEDLRREWSAMKHRDDPTLHRWLDLAMRRIKMGWSALNYLESAMEGELSLGIDEWRDLYAQSHQLACQLWGGVLGLQYRLDDMVSGLHVSS